MEITIHFNAKPPKPKPKVGDEKMIKGVLHVRELRMVMRDGKPIGVDKCGGRYHYDWIPKKPRDW